MLQRLTNDDVVKRWSVIKEGIMRSLPPTVPLSEDSISGILSSLISGRLQCWIENGEEEIKGLVLTGVMEDEFAGIRNLLIFSIYSNRTSSPEDWRDGINTLKAYAKGRGCYKIIAFTDREIVESIVLKLGGQVSRVLVEFDLD